MRRTLDRAFDQRFRPHWARYVLQSVLAAGSVFLVLVTLRQQNLLVAASMAATAFTVFVVPSSVTASARNVIGGHLVGVIIGSAFALIPQETVLLQDVMYAVAVGSAMLIMAATNTEHPPAAGTALGVVMAGGSWRLALGVAAGAVVLALIHQLLQPVLRDLVAAPEDSQSSVPE